MATSFASSAVPSLRYLVTEKLARNNHSLWKAQVLSTLQDVQVAHFLRSTTPIPLVTVAKSREKRTSKCPIPTTRPGSPRISRYSTIYYPRFPGTSSCRWPRCPPLLLSARRSRQCSPLNLMLVSSTRAWLLPPCRRGRQPSPSTSPR